MSYTIALAGHPNSGKTTIFNNLVGANEKIGNWPGTTVERKEGILAIADKRFTVVDLPGIYSLDASSSDEKIALDFLLYQKPDLVVAIIDASSLARNLYMVTQLLEMGQNVILVLNMMDIVRKNAAVIDVPTLSKILQIPVVPTVALTQEGLDELKKAILNSLNVRAISLHIDCGELENFIKQISDFFNQRSIDLGLPQRFAAIKIIENNATVLAELESQGHLKTVQDMLKPLTRQCAMDLETMIIERSYAYLKGVVKECLHRQLTIEERLTSSDKIDRIVTNRFLGIPIFLGFMYLLFSLVFKLGKPFVDAISHVFAAMAAQTSGAVEMLGLPPWVASLLGDGVIAGVGSVLSFLPYILLLFLGISFLEDSGYLARAAFVMDRFMHALGLHGKSFIPMLLGFGCNIPAILATRTLESEKDKILTILILPLMSCAARLPVYTLFAAALFPSQQGLVVFSLYIGGIILAIVMAKFFKSALFKKETAPLVIELPLYRLPLLRHVFLRMWLQVLVFVQKAGTIIFLSVIILWALASLPAGVPYASEKSIIGILGKFIAPVFRPAGFGFWQAAVALLSGMVAKEAMVGTLGTLYSAQQGSLAMILRENFTPLSAYAFLVMTLIYIPCIATIAVIKKEVGGKWASLAVAYTLILGWILSVLVYQIGRFFL